MILTYSTLLSRSVCSLRLRLRSDTIIGPHSLARNIAESPRKDTVELLSLLDELRIIAENGLEYADDRYDRERYERIMQLVEQYYGRTLRLPQESVRANLQEGLGHVTPKIGATAAIFDDEDRVLTMQRQNEEWCLPGGNTDPRESPEETVTRETKEETGLDIDIVELIDAYRLPLGTSYDPHGAITLLYRCIPISGELKLSEEGLNLQWQQIEAVPDWFFDHKRSALEASGRLAEENP